MRSPKSVKNPLIQSRVRSLFSLFTLLILTPIPVKAQIIPDKTLGKEASQITPNILINGNYSDRIDGGAQRGSNLFHSFTQFNIGNGQNVYFSNPSGVTNILARVTGGNVSNILGTLGVNGNANLFLINPNGIIFGPNSSLDVQGSFLATTANAIQFGNKGIFSATKPQAPPLLTIDPSALLFNQLNQGAAITNQSQAPAGVDPIGLNVTGLRVPNGKSLLLVGGNVNLDGGGLTANGGRVELAGLAEPGAIGLNVAGNTVSLNVPTGVQLGDISLTNASVFVYGSSGGDIAINAHNLEISNSSLLAGNINLLANSSKAGNININADSISLSNDTQIYNFADGIGDGGDIFISAHNAISLDGSFIISNVFSNAVGNGGSINIQAGNVSLINGGEISTQSSGKGNSGNITVNTFNTFSLDGSFIDSQLLFGAVGNSGNINIQAGNVSLINSGEITSRSSGQGNSGNITVNAFNTLSLNGSFIDSQLFFGTVGNAGDINIQAGTLSLSNGGSISSTSSGQGNSGNISFDVLDTFSLDRGIVNSVFFGAVGNSGNINIQAGTLSLSNGGSISSTSSGQGNSGNMSFNVRNAFSLDESFINSQVLSDAVGNSGDINILAGSFSLTNGGQINSNNFGQGNSGNISVNVRNTFSLDEGFISSQVSLISSQVSLGAIGNSGDINIQAGSFSLTNSGSISSGSSGKGSSGNISFNVRDAFSLENGGFISSEISSGAVGNAGDIQIQSENFSLTNGGISSSSSSKGNSGNITFNVRDAFSVDGNESFISSEISSGAVGKAGDIQIQSENLSLTNGGVIITSSFGKGNSGNITFNVGDDLKISGTNSRIQTTLDTGAVGKAGDIQIQSENFSLSNGGVINSRSFSQGNGGNVNVNIRNAFSVDKSFIFTSTLSGATGNAGDINIESGNFSLTNSTIDSSSSGQGNGGSIIVNVHDGLTISGTGSIILTTLFGNRAVGNAGDIQIQSGNFSLSNGGLIASNSFSQGNSGNISVDVYDTLAISGIGSQISSALGSPLVNGAVGHSGDVNIQAGNISLTNSGAVTSDTFGYGNSGNIFIISPNSIILDNAIISNSVQAHATGKGGDITITANALSLDNGAQINSFTRGTGNGGNITITANNAVTVDGSFSDGASSSLNTLVDAGGIGKGGNIDIIANSLSLTNSGQIRSSVDGASGTLPSGQGIAGDINIQVPTLELNHGKILAQTASGNGGNISLDLSNYLFLRNGSQISATAGTAQAGGNGGNMTINTPFVITVPNQSNDITANAFTGNGGNIYINAESLFGIIASPQLLDPINTITASSQLGVQGQVTIATPEVQPTKGITKLPTEAVDSSKLIVENCPRGLNAKPLSNFIVTGHGSLPPSPMELMTGKTTRISLATLDDKDSGKLSPKISALPVIPATSPHTIIEAQGWITTDDGTIILVPYKPNTIPSSRLTATMCPQ